MNVINTDINNKDINDKDVNDKDVIAPSKPNTGSNPNGVHAITLLVKLSTD